MLLLVSVGYAFPCKAWFSIDRLVAKTIITTVKFSLRCGVHIVVNNPQTIALLMAIYFYKEIINIGKDIASQIAGEFPYVALAAGVVGLYFVMKHCDGLSKIKKKMLSFVDKF